jgi:hypothetical protein
VARARPHSSSLGASIAATALIEGFVFAIVAYLDALLEAGAAIAVASSSPCTSSVGSAHRGTHHETTSTRMHRFG